jgi:two-component system, chemotaxis family, sensor kinase Cph1
MTTLPDAIQRLMAPGHLCCIYDSEGEKLSSVVPFLQVGLERGERCAYAVQDPSFFPAVLEALKQRGVDVDAATRSGALMLTTTDVVYLRGGNFDSQAMLGFWRHLKDGATRDSFSGFRGAAETTGWPANLTFSRTG